MSVKLAFKLKMAKQQAELLLKNEGMLAATKIDPIALANKRDIMVKAKDDAEPGVSGMLLHHGNSFGIMYATYVPSTGFQRFSIAHELGHYFLEGHVDQILKTGVHASYAGFVSADPYEMEADAFAAGLLMPSSPMKKLLKLHDPGMAIVDKVAETFETSLTAAAIRYAELTDDAIAVIVSTGQTIDYCFLSDGMKSLPNLDWLKKGTPVPHSTCTHAFNADAKNVAGAERFEDEIDVRQWLGGSNRERVVEEVVGLGRYGKTLTILSSRSIGTDEESEDDEDERLADSWTPKFRR